MRANPFHDLDAASGGRLRRLLTSYRDDGLSFREMSERLKVDMGLTRSHETVRSWVALLDDKAA